MNINDSFRCLGAGLPGDIQRCKANGDFDEAVRLIDLRLERSDQPEALRACMIAQKEMIRRMPLDFIYTKAEALELVRRHIPDFTEAEFDRRVDEGGISWVYIKGERRYFNRFFDNLCKVDPAFARRAGVILPGNESAQAGSGTLGRLDSCILKMKTQGSVKNRIRIRASIRLKDEYFEKGIFVRAHLPIPAACSQQSEIVIEKLWPENGIVAPEDTPQRTVCWEEHMSENHEFCVEYSYSHKAEYHELEKPCGHMAEISPELTGEKLPHIVFTPFIKALAEELTQGVSEPLEKARRFYDFITLKMKYSFMPAYFTLESIAENCARNYTGDCGVLALTFITLCRCVGIPARWQSGLAAEPDFCGAHDWVEFYIPGHGWLFADPSYGTAAVRAENEERRRFYFGNLDPYRMVANSDFQADFVPCKEHWRADPYDNQLGEMETGDRGLNYDEFEYSKEVLLCEEI